MGKQQELSSGQLRLLAAGVLASLLLHALLLLFESSPPETSGQKSGGKETRISLGLRSSDPPATGMQAPQTQTPPAVSSPKPARQPSVNREIQVPGNRPTVVPNQSGSKPQPLTSAASQSRSHLNSQAVTPAENTVDSRETESLPATESTSKKQATNPEGRTGVRGMGSAQRSEQAKLAPPTAITSQPVAYYDNPHPPYPDAARRRGWHGEVILLVQVNLEGGVEKVSVEKSSGHLILDRSALQHVRRWHFRPAAINGNPVSGNARVPIRFELKGR